MMSLIDVTCPHCGAKGRIMAPPLGAIIFGPCPECQEMVVIFCGQALPLDKTIMTQGSEADKKEHLLEAIGLYLHDRIDQLFSGEAQETLEHAESPAEETPEAEAGEEPQESAPHFLSTAAAAAISDSELDTFRNIELRLIDNKEYFRAVFE